MRIIFALAIALGLSLTVNVYLYDKFVVGMNKNNIENPYQGARKADDAAAQIVDKAREEAAIKAQEKRDALKDIGSMDSVDGLLERCRRGLFGKGGNTDCASDATKGSDGTMPKSKNP